MYRYAHTIDVGDSDGWADCFTSDGVFQRDHARKRSTSPTGRVRAGATPSTSSSTTRVRPALWHKHMIVEPMITIDGETPARETYFPCLMDHEDHPIVRVFGRYLDKLRRERRPVAVRRAQRVPGVDDARGCRRSPRAARPADRALADAARSQARVGRVAARARPTGRACRWAAAAAGRRRQHIARDLPPGEARPGGAAVSAAGDSSRAGLGRDHGHHLLGPDRVGNPEHERLGRRRAPVEHDLDLLGADVLARALDHVLEAARGDEMAVAGRRAAVAGANPAVGERRRRCSPDHPGNRASRRGGACGSPHRPVGSRCPRSPKAAISARGHGGPT